MKILAIPIANLQSSELLTKIQQHWQKPQPLALVGVNPEYLLATQVKPEVQKFLEKSLNFADGIGLIWAVNFQQKPNYCPKIIWLLLTLGALLGPKKWLMRRGNLKHLCATDFWPKLLTLAEKLQIRVTILTPTQIPKAPYQPATPAAITKALHQSWPQLKFGFGINPDANLVLDARGMTKATEKITQGVYAPVGGFFDYLTGHIPRAPHCFRILGLEWLWRAFANQRFNRIWHATFGFIQAIWRDSN